MKRIIVALSLLSLTGCAQVLELDHKIATAMNPGVKVVQAETVGKPRQGLKVEAGGNVAYYHTYDRKPTTEELQYAQATNAEFDAMVKNDQERVREEIKVDPRVTARTICDLIFVELKAKALRDLELGDYRMVDALDKKGQQVYNECYDEQLEKAKND